MELLDQTHDKIRPKQDSIRTKQAYVVWIRGFPIFHSQCHPQAMRKREFPQHPFLLTSYPDQERDRKSLFQGFSILGIVDTIKAIFMLILS
jgi:hypothetical protein